MNAVIVPQSNKKYTFACGANGCGYHRVDLKKREAEVEATSHAKHHLLSCGCIVTPQGPCKHGN